MKTEKKAFLYIEDDPKVVEAFRDNVRRKWNMNCDVLSNSTYGPITREMYDKFEDEVFNLIEHRFSHGFYV